MKENKKIPSTWEEIEKKYAEMESRELLASEVISWSQKVAKAKDFAIVCLAAAITTIAITTIVVGRAESRK